MRKTTKKGFTLMELIIVIALFSVIMVLVMSFIDPAAKLMTKTSTKEKTAAYVDNINEYIDKSLRYATFARVCESNFCLSEGTDPRPPKTEAEAVQEFIDDFFDGAIDSNGNPVTGKVHVLKLLNEPARDDLTKVSTYDGKSGATLKDGVLIDVVYDFEAGDSRPGKAPSGKDIQIFGGTFKHSKITGPVSNELAVNPEHFRYYSYYYSLGFHEFIPVSNRTVTKNNPESEAVSYNDSLITKSDGTANRYSTTSGSIPIKGNNSLDFYYKELIPMRDLSGNKLDIDKYAFAITTIAYPNDAKGNNKVNCTKIVTDPADGSTASEPTVIFKSPCYMATSSMALSNVSVSLTNNPTCVMKDQDLITGDVKPDSKLVQVKIFSDPFAHFKAVADDPADDTTNIYFIYVVPSEVNN